MPSVLRPIVDALAPPDGARAVRRTRNLMLGFAALALLAPRAAELGTGTTDARNAEAAVFAAFGVASHFLAPRPQGPWIVSGAAGALGIAAWAITGALWGPALAAIVVAFLAAAALRQRAGHRADARPADFRPGGFLRFAAGLAASFVSMLIFTTFAVMPIHVPTGSMEPTIYGRSATSGEDFILVDRFAYAHRDPARWEIAVFEFPLHRGTNFVKRIVGLPGETVEIRGGDLWVDGRIARKPALVQESLWRGEFPSSLAAAKKKDVAAAFRAEGGDRTGGWSRDGAGVRGAAKGDAPSWFGYHLPLSVPDLRVGARVTPSPGASAHLRITSRGTPIVLTVGAGRDATGSLVIGTDPPIPVTRGAEPGDVLELSTAEGVVRATLNGAEIAAGETSCEGPSKHGCALGASGGTVSFHGIRVERDVVYVAKGMTRWEVPAGHYVALGDNSEFSEDSREWVVTEIDVRGAAAPLRTAADLLSEEGGRRANLSVADGVLRFTDTDGVPRSVARADVAARRDGVARPFVPRDHILGRAVLIYWPWVPGPGGFRPRILP